MRAKYFIIGAASSFVLLLIVGGIFAIRAEPGSQEIGSAPSNSPAPSPLAAAPQTSSNSPAPVNAIFANDVDPAAAGYTVLASADSGSTIFAQKPDATTVQAAIIAALHDLTHILDSKPTVQGAFADAQQQHRGGATFTGKLKGLAIKGNIMCGIGDKGAAITVVYDRAEAGASARS